MQEIRRASISTGERRKKPPVQEERKRKYYRSMKRGKEIRREKKLPKHQT
jgi:hypothetical protein